MDEELEKTGIFTSVDKDHDDYVSVRERLEQVEDKLEYLGVPIWKKNKIDELINEIKEITNEEEEEEKFEELINLLEDD